MALALANYHPQLREAVLADVPDTAGGSAFLADGKLSAAEIAALDRAQSVFGLDKFYRAWELDELTPNQVHAVLYMLTFYDPYHTVHDVTADPDDPDAEGAALTKALDDFGVYPGTCLYCKGQKSGQPRNRIANEGGGIGLHRRMILLHLAHHAKVQADALSPCDLRDFTEEELIALGVMDIRAPSSSKYAYNMLQHNFAASVRLTDELLAAGIDAPRGRDPDRERTAKVLIRPGEVLSPFTHAMRAAGGAPSERGLEPCLEAVKRIVDWDAKRYTHYSYRGETLYPFFRGIFPSHTTDDKRRDYPYSYGSLHYSFIPQWAWFLVDESGGPDKAIRLMNQFRALNLPAVREGDIIFDETAYEAVSEYRRGRSLHYTAGVLLSPYRLYLHRNIGFSVDDYQASLDDRIRRFSFPERCRIERYTPGALPERPRPGYSPSIPSNIWERDPSAGSRPSFHDLDFFPGPPRIPKYYPRPNLMYVCD